MQIFCHVLETIRSFNRCVEMKGQDLAFQKPDVHAFLIYLKLIFA